MAGKLTGLGHAFYLDGYDLSGDTMRPDGISTPLETINQTDITMSAMARTIGQKSGRLALTSFFNVDSGRAHAAYSTLPRTDRYGTYCWGTAIGSPTSSIVGKQINYDPDRSESGELLLTVELQSSGFNLEWGTLMTAGTRADTAATNGTGIDYSASSAFGLQAYLHVVAFTGTSVTVKIQHSSDNGSVDPYADVTGGAFTAATAIGAQRIATTNALTIKRWLRVVTTGTFSAASFVVAVVRNGATVTF